MRYDGSRKSERVMELSHVKKTAAQALLLVVGIAMLCFGVWRGEAATVLSKAIKLCLELSLIHISLVSSKLHLQAALLPNQNEGKTVQG